MSQQSITRIANRYRLLRKLGQGGMGVVYHAHDDLVDRPVALKQVLVSADQLQIPNSVGTSNIYVALTTEFRTLANLRHPYVVQVLDYGFDSAGNPFFTMEYVPDAQPITDAGHASDADFQVQALGQMLMALVYLHRRGIIHRDLKPGNVLVDTNHNVRVLDFGLALETRLSQSSLNSPKGHLVGTLAYIAPEIISDENYSVASDLFAVGIMAYEILAGKHPFDITSIAKLLMEILTIPTDTSDIDERFADWVGALLDKDPKQRPQSAQNALQQLYEAVNQEIPAQDSAVRESFLRASRFVGRKTELTRLMDALETIKTEGSTEKHTAFLLGGESGVGKSRLLEEVRTRALIKGFRVLRGQAVETGGVPYQMMRDIVRPLLLSTDVSDLEAGILKEVIPDVERLIGRDVPDVPALSGQANLTRLNLTIIDLLKNQTQPLLLIIEDVQWTEQSKDALALLLRLLDQFENPVMVLASYRSDEAPTMPEIFGNMQHMLLQRLDRDVVRKLVISMLGKESDTEELLDVLERETEGNIFFIVEVMRALAETAGSLERVVEVGLPEKIVAGGMIDILRRRLNAMPTEFQEMLQLAAVIGRQLDVRALEAALPKQSIDAFVTAGANHAIFDFADDNWRFAHDKLRETIIDDLAQGERVALHRQAAEAIEATYPDDDAYAEMLVLHWDVAGNAAKTVHYTNIACERLIQFTGEYDKAEAYLKRGLKLAETLTDAQHIQSHLHKHYGELHRRRGNWVDAESAFKQAVKAAEDTPDFLVRPLSRLAVVYTKLGNVDEAIRCNKRALALVEAGYDPQWEPYVYLANADIADVQGDYADYLSNAQQALSIIQTADNVDRHIEAKVLGMLGIAHYQSADLVVATDYFEQALLVYQEMGDRYQAAYLLRNLGYLAQLDDDLSGAEQKFREALTIMQEIGSNNQFEFQANLATLEVKRGNYSDAIAHYDEFIDWLRQMQQTPSLVEAINMQTHAYLLMGEKESAAANLRECLTLLDDLESKPLILATLIQVAHWHAVLQQRDEAVRYLAMIEGQTETPQEYVDLHLLPLKEKWQEELAADDFARWSAEWQERDFEVMVTTAKLRLQATEQEEDQAD